MKTIGILGGMSWESTAKYYQWLNEGIRERLGGLHSAKILMNSVDFAEIERCQSSSDWETAGNILVSEAMSLQNAGADCVILATNTMHKVADDIQKAITIPFLHLADQTALEIEKRKISKVGLLATIYTMEQDFYKQRLEDRGIEVIVPPKDERVEINRIIFEELCLGQIKDASRKTYLNAANKLLDEGVEGLILGCTEINMLLSARDFDAPVFDTTRIHIEAALEFALSDIT